jgi:DNA-binding transcriptional MerR regulator/effector-binding domain-containing protein
MDRGMISIGKMARINHTTVTTLRLYDRLGLLKPCLVDESSGYRYYDIKQSARFDMIQYMQELGMELKEIKSVLDREDLNQIESVLIRKEEKTAAQIESLMIQKDAIRKAIQNIERYKKSPRSGTTTLEYLSGRRIYSIHTDVNFYDHGMDTYELILKQLKEDLLSNHLPEIYYCNAGTILRQDLFKRQQFSSDEMFVFVDDHFPRMERTRVIEDNMYACIYCDSFENEKRYAEQLLQYCRDNRYEICGDYLCEVLIEFNVFNESQRSMYLRLQVPVIFS